MNCSTRDPGSDPVIRYLTAGDEEFLWEYLYLALFVPEGHPPLPRDILREPSIARYVSNWGRDGDFGVLASAPAGGDIGAAWLRRWTDGERGYGYVAAEFPELSMAVRPGQRGRGVGTLMLRTLLDAADERGWCVSLSVLRENPACRLYRRCGFVEHEDHGDSVTMLRRAPACGTAGGRKSGGDKGRSKGNNLNGEGSEKK